MEKNKIILSPRRDPCSCGGAQCRFLRPQVSAQRAEPASLRSCAHTAPAEGYHWSSRTSPLPGPIYTRTRREEQHSPRSAGAFPIWLLAASRDDAERRVVALPHLGVMLPRPVEQRLLGAGVGHSLV